MTKGSPARHRVRRPAVPASNRPVRQSGMDHGALVLRRRRPTRCPAASSPPSVAPTPSRPPACAAPPTRPAPDAVGRAEAGPALARGPGSARRMFERGRFRVRPTQAGRALYPEAKTALAALERAAHVDPAAVQGGRARELRHCAPRATPRASSSSRACSPPSANADPDAHVTAEVVNSPGVLGLLADGTVEIGFVEGLTRSTGLETLVLRTRRARGRRGRLSPLGPDGGGHAVRPAPRALLHPRATSGHPRGHRHGAPWPATAWSSCPPSRRRARRASSEPCSGAASRSSRG
ncbi:MAG: hypothetical protein WKG07_36015 [Hymenobacter sp.]